MPPLIALFLCITFIIFLFVLDKRKTKYEPSWALWVPLLFMLISASRPLALWFNPTLLSVLPADASDGSPADRNFYIFLIITGLFILFKRKLNWSLIIKDNLWIFLLFLYCGISIAWSDLPYASLKAWIKVMVIPIMALIIITEINYIESLRTVLQRTAYILIPLSIVLIKYFPAYGRSYSPWDGTTFYGGVTTYKNGLGVLCFIAGIFIVWNLIIVLRDKSTHSGKIPVLVNIAMLCMILWLLMISDSATALTVFIVGVCVLIALEIPIIKNNLNIVVFILLLLGLFTFLSFNAFEGLVTSLGRDTTLTGRTAIWKKVLSMDTNPMIGSGYASFWLGDRGEFLLNLNWQRLTQAHNGFIEVYLNLGLVGLGLLIMMIVKTYKNAKNSLSTDFEYGKLQISYMTVFILTNVTEATFAIKSISWFMFVLISLKYLKSGDTPKTGINPVNTKSPQLIGDSVTSNN